MLSVVLINSLHNHYTQDTIIEFKSMKRPITLQNKSKIMFWYSVELRDGKGNSHCFGNFSSLANEIGEIYQINDTIQ